MCDRRQRLVYAGTREKDPTQFSDSPANTRWSKKLSLCLSWRARIHSTFISRLRGARWTIIVLGILVFGYLLMSAAATQIVRDRQGELARIEASTNLVELKAHASGLAMIGNNANHISMVLLWIAMLALLFFVVLAFVNLHSLGRLEKGINERSPHA